MTIAAKPNAPLPLQSVFLAYAFALLLMQNAEDALAVAETIGFPVMIKVKRSGRGGRDGGQRRQAPACFACSLVAQLSRWPSSSLSWSQESEAAMGAEGLVRG